MIWKRSLLPQSDADREKVFRLATQTFVQRYKEMFDKGMTDAELQMALENSFDVFRGWCGPSSLSVAVVGSNIRIWGGWHIVNHHAEAPIFARMQTIKMARVIYNIADPNNQQLDLF